MSAAPLLIIGVGNDERGDDAVGLLVLRALAATPLASRLDVVLQEQSGEGTRLIEAWAEHQRVVVIDALWQPDSAPGTIVELQGVALQGLSLGARGGSSHGFSVADAVRLAHALGRLPPELCIYGVVGVDFALGHAISPEVEAAVPRLAERIRARASA